jgi:polysaccharide pyruvyl transferase CsaB
VRTRSRDGLRVLLAGYFGFGNLGDEAILATVAHGLATQLPDVRLTVVAGDPLLVRREHGLDAVRWSDLLALDDAVRASSAVVLAGGGVWQDVVRAPAGSLLRADHAGVSTYATVAHLAAVHGRPVHVLGNGVGPLVGADAQALTVSSLALAGHLTVRDRGSADLLGQLSPDLGDVAVTADPVWALPVPRPSTRAGRDRPRLVVGLRQWGEPGAWVRRVAAALDAVVDACDAEVLFLPSQQVDWPGLDDAVAARAVVSAMRRGDAARLLEPGSLTQVDEVLAGADAVLAVRLHVALLAARLGVPCVGLAYDRKVSALFDQLGRSDRCLPLDGPAEALAEVLLGAVRSGPDRDPRVEQLRATAEADLAALAGRLRGDEPPAPLPAVTADVLTDVTARTVREAEQGRRLAADAQRTQDELRELVGGLREQLRAALERESEAQAELAGLRGLPAQLAEAQEQAAAAHQAGEERQAELEDLRSAQAELAFAREEDDQIAAQVRAERDHLQQVLADLRASTVWPVLELLWHARLRAAPPGSSRERVASRALRLRRTARSRLAPAVRRARVPALGLLLGDRHLFADRYTPEHNARVVVYGDEFPDHRERRVLREQHDVAATLVAVVLNEVATLDAWLDAVRRQTHLPAEVVVVDGGSTDGTVERLQAAVAGFPVPLRVFAAPGSSISRGRNVGVAAASYDTIAVTDLGAVPEERWLARLLAPFAADPAVEVSAGFYTGTAAGGAVLERDMWPSLDQVWPAGFLPSSRSIAFRTSAWEAVGGYPEWLRSTGEDTWFALELKRCCSCWAFVPSARVRWYAPVTARDYWDKARYWSRGDGQSGVFARTYSRSAELLLSEAALAVLAGASAAAVTRAGGSQRAAAATAAAVAAAGVARLSSSTGTPATRLALESGMHAARVRGFLEGSRQREEVARLRSADVRGLLVILSGVPIDDTGGGARATQIALEALRQRWRVVFVNAFPRYETVDLDLVLAHPDLSTTSLADLDVDALLAETAAVRDGRPAAVVLEFPMAEFLDAAVRLRAHGVQVVYDLLDEWNSSLGAEWYSPDVEDRVVDAADVLVATAPSLERRLATRSGREVVFLPNAVNARLFDPRRSHVRPADLPAAAWTVAYVGALWGDWFDWELLLQVAEAHPDAAVVVIGDYHGQSPRTLPNLHFLGLKRQTDLPAYLAHVDVALMPWFINDVTRATSPLKLYEYLAMHKPVVAPDLPPLHGAPNVLLSPDRASFVRDVGRARDLVVDTAAADAYTARNSWQERISRLLAAVERAHDDRAGRSLEDGRRSVAT